MTGNEFVDNGAKNNKSFDKKWMVSETVTLISGNNLPLRNIIGIINLSSILSISVK